MHLQDHLTLSSSRSATTHRRRVLGMLMSAYLAGVVIVAVVTEVAVAVCSSKTSISISDGNLVCAQWVSASRLRFRDLASCILLGLNPHRFVSAMFRLSDLNIARRLLPAEELGHTETSDVQQLRPSMRWRWHTCLGLGLDFGKAATTCLGASTLGRADCF